MFDDNPAAPDAAQIRAVLRRGVPDILAALPFVTILSCGSFARNEFIPAWSDVDLVAMADSNQESVLCQWVRSQFQHWPDLDVGIRCVSQGTLSDMENVQVVGNAKSALWSSLPFGIAKVFDAFTTIGGDSQLLCGAVHPIKIDRFQKDMIWAAGVRDTIRTISNLQLTDHMTAVGYRRDRTLIGQVVNLCRILLRIEGCHLVLNYKNVESAIQTIPIFPDITKRFIRDVVSLRQRVRRLEPGWQQMARHLAERAAEVHQATLDSTQHEGLSRSDGHANF